MLLPEFCEYWRLDPSAIKYWLEVPPFLIKESLVDIHDGIFTEYYPGKKQKKFQGEQDENGQRQGKWTFYGPEGLELSTTHYEHGIRHGHSIVKYPNGAIHYYGEYNMDQQIGIWKSYDMQGNLTEEKDYGQK